MPGTGRNIFTDPATGNQYVWQVNHDTEQAFGKQRNIQRTARTGYVGLVRQQGDDGPLLIQLTGTILHREQYRQMWSFYHLSQSQTIYFTDFDGGEYEVQVTHFTPVRVRTARNPRDSSIPNHYWTYDIEMDVLRILAGDLADIGLTT